MAEEASKQRNMSIMSQKPEVTHTNGPTQSTEVGSQVTGQKSGEAGSAGGKIEKRVSFGATAQATEQSGGAGVSATMPTDRIEKSTTNNVSNNGGALGKRTFEADCSKPLSEKVSIGGSGLDHLGVMAVVAYLKFLFRIARRRDAVLENNDAKVSAICPTFFSIKHFIAIKTQSNNINLSLI